MDQVTSQHHLWAKSWHFKCQLCSAIISLGGLVQATFSGCSFHLSYGGNIHQPRLIGYLPGALKWCLFSSTSALWESNIYIITITILWKRWGGENEGVNESRLLLFKSYCSTANTHGKTIFIHSTFHSLCSSIVTYLFLQIAIGSTYLHLLSTYS